MPYKHLHRSLIALLALPAFAGGAAAQTPRFDLDTLEVRTGSRASATLPVATRAVEVVTAEALAGTPARTLAEALAWALGVDLQARSPAQADIALRGGSFEQLLVLVDGVRMSDAQTGHFDLDLAIPLEEVERIEILRGPATALYGSDAVGGVVHIVTRRGPDALRTSIEAGSFGTAAVSAAAGAGDEGLGVRVAAEHRRSDGHRPGTDYRATQARAALDAAVGGRRLRADAAFAARDFGARAFYVAPQIVERFGFDEYEETRAATASLAWLAPGDAAFALEPRVSVRRHEDDFLLKRDDPDFYHNRHASVQLGGELVARWAAAPALDLAFGAEAYRDRLESSNLGDREESRAALFAEAAAGRVGRAALTAGLRADWHSAFGAFLAPSVAGALWPADPLRVRASVGRAFRAPTWTERYYRDPSNEGTPDLAPERAWEAELGADLTAAPGVRVGVSGFVRSADALIDWARPADGPADAPWRTRNVASALFRGLELEGSVADLLGARWSLAATALAFDAEDDGGFTSKYALRPLTRTASLAVERALPAGLSLSLRAFHGRRAGEDRPAIADGACVAGAAQAHTRADARLGWRTGGAHLHLDLLNLGDAEYCDVSGVIAPGRAAFIGVSWSR